MQQFIQRYQPHANEQRNESTCLVTIYRDLNNNDATLVIFTELASNRGKSITNSSEALATLIVRDYELDPNKTTFVEHYGAISYHFSTAPHCNEHYSTVCYSWNGGKARGPVWSALSAKALESLVNGFVAEVNA